MKSDIQELFKAGEEFKESLDLTDDEFREYVKKYAKGAKTTLKGCVCGFIAKDDEFNNCPLCGREIGIVIHNNSDYERIIYTEDEDRGFVYYEHAYCEGSMDTAKIKDKYFVKCRRCYYRTEIQKPDSCKPSS